MTPMDALQGINFMQQLAEQGVTPDQFPISISALKKTSGEAGYKPQEVIQAAMKLTELETQSGKKYPEATKVLETTILQENEIIKRNKERIALGKRLRAKISQLEDRIKENQVREQQSFRQANVTPEQLSEFLKYKEKLNELDIDFNDIKTIVNILDNVKETGFNPRLLVSLAKKLGSLTKSLAYFESQVPLKKQELGNLLAQMEEFKKVLSELTGEKNRLQMIVNSLENEISVLNVQLYNLKINIAELEKRRQAIIIVIGKHMGLSEQEIENLLLTSRFDVQIAVIEARIGEIVKSYFGQS